MSNKIVLKNRIIEIEGNIYVISDIHACFYTFQNILKLIDFSNKDFLIINGDLIDRGKSNIIDFIKYLKSFNNILLIRGNHEEFYIRYDNKELSETQWYNWGGKNTITNLKKASIDDKLMFHNYIIKTPLFVEVIINDENYFISHNGYSLDLPIVKENENINQKDTIIKQFNTNWFEFFVSNDINYIPSKNFEKHWIVGHLPTMNTLGKSSIYKRNLSTHIDCGASYDNGRMGILRLNDFAEFYENINKKDI